MVGWEHARRWDGAYANESFSSHPGCDLLPPQTASSLWENTRGRREAASLKVGTQRLDIRGGGVATRWRSCNTGSFAACFPPFIPRTLTRIIGCHARCVTVLHRHSLPDRRQLLVSSGLENAFSFPRVTGVLKGCEEHGVCWLKTRRLPCTISLATPPPHTTPRRLVSSDNPCRGRGIRLTFRGGRGWEGAVQSAPGCCNGIKRECPPPPRLK